MTTEIFRNYAVVTDLCSAEQLMSLDALKDEQIAAVVVNNDAEFSVNEAERRYFEECGFLTVLYSDDLSAFSPDFIMLFDIRLSKSDYPVTPEIFKKIDIKRYRLICGKTDTYRLVSNFSSKNPSDYRGSLVKKADGIDSAKEYCEALFRDKSDFETGCIVKCLTASRTGNTKLVREKESVNFYTMIREKVKDC